MNKFKSFDLFSKSLLIFSTCYHRLRFHQHGEAHIDGVFTVCIRAYMTNVILPP